MENGGALRSNGRGYYRLLEITYLAGSAATIGREKVNTITGAIGIGGVEGE
jgi:hypothetical protein